MTIVKEEHNKRGQLTYCEWSNGYWEKHEYDNKGNETYFEHSDGYWDKYKYDKAGKEIYCENSEDGVLYDYRNKEDIRVENVRNFMEQIEGLTKKGNYSDFEVALLICERSNIHSSEINKELVDKVMNISQSCDTLFSDYINDELSDVFENEIQEENEFVMEI